MFVGMCLNWVNWTGHGHVVDLFSRGGNGRVVRLQWERMKRCSLNVAVWKHMFVEWISLEFNYFELKSTTLNCSCSHDVMSSPSDNQPGAQR